MGDIIFFIGEAKHEYIKKSTCNTSLQVPFEEYAMILPKQEHCSIFSGTWQDR